MDTSSTPEKLPQTSGEQHSVEGTSPVYCEWLVHQQQLVLERMSVDIDESEDSDDATSNQADVSPEQLDLIDLQIDTSKQSESTNCDMKSEDSEDSSPEHKIPIQIKSQTLTSNGESFKKYSCPQCHTALFHRKKSVWAHIAIVHGKKRFECEKCTKAFVTKSKLDRHATMHHDLVCSLCDFVCQGFNTMRSHKKRAHPKFHNCSQCGLNCASRAALRDHIVTHSSPDVRIQIPCVYPGCPKVFAYRRNMVSHCAQTHEKQHFPCPMDGCNFQLATKQRLETHLKLHASRSKSNSILSKQKPSKDSKKPSSSSKQEKSISSTDCESDSSITKLLTEMAKPGPSIL